MQKYSWWLSINHTSKQINTLEGSLDVKFLGGHIINNTYM